MSSLALPTGFIEVLKFTREILKFDASAAGDSWGTGKCLNEMSVATEENKYRVTLWTVSHCL